jgi:hypothetical protein
VAQHGLSRDAQQREIKRNCYRLGTFRSEWGSGIRRRRSRLAAAMTLGAGASAGFRFFESPRCPS